MAKTKWESESKRLSVGKARRMERPDMAGDGWKWKMTGHDKTHVDEGYSIDCDLSDFVPRHVTHREYAKRDDARRRGRERQQPCEQQRERRQ
jgi:hypothetical protein